MTINRTTLLGLPLPVTGTESGAWGDVTNNGLSQYIDTSVAGALSITGTVTLANTLGDASATNLGATTAQYRTLIIPASGPSANIVITAPSSNRTYHVINRNATYTVQIRAGANSGVTLAVNQSATVSYDSVAGDYVLVGGNVVGPASATDNAVVRFDGTTGKLVQNSVVTIADSTGDVAGVGALTATGNVSFDGGTFVFNESGADKDFRIEGDTDANLFFTDASTDRVGIGTSSPTNKLHVEGSGTTSLSLVKNTSNFTGGTNFTQPHVTINSGNDTTGNVTRFAMSVGNGAQVYLDALMENGTTVYSSLLFRTRGADNVAERMRLDSSGNLGLGVTPSAWDSSIKAFQVNNQGALWSISSSNPNVILSTNTRLVGSTYYYVNTGVATQYYQTSGQHQWLTAASGTAGNAITFTQALTLDADRNLLLNGTSAGASSVGTFAIFNGTAPTGSVTNGIILYAEDVSSSSELKVRDEAGNVTTLSPHNFSLIPDGPSEDMAWAYYSEKGGKRINVDMLKLARMVEKLTGEKLVYES